MKKLLPILATVVFINNVNAESNLNEGNVYQDGEYNQAFLFQLQAQENNIQLTQDSSLHAQATAIQQNTTVSTIKSYQKGLKNLTHLEQNIVTNSSLSMTQIGNSNQTIGSQAGIELTLATNTLGDDNRIDVQQSGSKHNAQVSQLGNDNQAALNQNGGLHRSIISQDGVGNLIILDQSGSVSPLQNGNTSNSRQSGEFNKVTYNQIGELNILTIEQAGHQNEINGHSLGNNNKLTASQFDENNTFFGYQDGTSNTTILIQSDNNNFSSSYQYGISNEITIHQGSF